jgi:hypothetical protein
LLEISKKKVSIACRKIKTGDLEHKRGGGRPRLSEQLEQTIRNHINSMPRCLPENDDSNPTSSLQHLDPDLNLGIMYQLFQDHWAKKNPDTPPPSISSYRRILISMGLKFKHLESQLAKKTTEKGKVRKKRPSRSKKSKVEKKQQALDERPTTYQMNFESFQEK